MRIRRGTMKGIKGGTRIRKEVTMGKRELQKGSGRKEERTREEKRCRE